MSSESGVEQTDLDTMEVDTASCDYAGPSSQQEWSSGPKIDETSIELTKPQIDRFIGILDQLDSKVEKLRKDALMLKEKKDFLAMSMDLLRNNEYLTGLKENEYEEIDCYVQRISVRLSTVELSVFTIRDPAQEDCLHRVNSMIDEIISRSDPAVSRLRCQQFLNACCTTDTTTYTGLDPNMCSDKSFENALLGCTLDDQKIIKKRLQALLDYLAKQTVVH